ncbi:MAG: hypothetical protein QOD61_148 [Solirubrobacteraceae bacterium]|jgi:hypothetical protein|nr:hypothetical protein [Solirubrobacteraceae bacterium]MEA2354019.1 hypothetical protein [Solirubrobacteraceae bacterium]
MPRLSPSARSRARRSPAGRRSGVALSRALGLVVALLALGPAGAQASPQALIRDCMTNGRIVGHYSQQDYSQALANLPTDVAEYSDCAGVIRRAQLAAAAGGAGAVTPRAAQLGAGAGGGGAAAAAGGGVAASAANPRQDPLTYADPAERAAIARARSGGSSQIDLGGQLVRPGTVATRTSSILNSLPTPLVIALAALAAIAVVVCGRYARNLVRARRAD